jgi:hypothetical protein
MSRKDVLKYLKSKPRVAMSTFCTFTAMLFVERITSHGKVFLKNSMIPWITTPHRYYAYMTEETNIDNGGIWRHFTGGMRYSKQGARENNIPNGLWDRNLHTEITLQELTLTLLQDMNVCLKYIPQAVSLVINESTFTDGTRERKLELGPDQKRQKPGG